MPANTVVTAVGGGVLRDITARETPALVQVDTDLYAIPAAAAAVFLFRIVAMLRHWTAPRAR